MNAYITLLSSRNYLPGVLALSNSLRIVKSAYPLVCTLSKDIDIDVEKDLERHGIRCIRLNENVVGSNANPEEQAFSHWNFTFDKLQVWGLEGFEKLIFLDSDMLVIRNIDHLFEKDAFSAVCAGKSYPGHESWNTLNSGLVVINPNKKVKQALVDLIDPVIQKFQAKNLLVGDQDILHEYLPDWKDECRLHLDEGYNMFADYLTWYIKNNGYAINGKGKPIYVIHFIGKLKPWMRPNVRKSLWLLRMCLRNPYYAWACWKFRKYLRLDSKR